MGKKNRIRIREMNKKDHISKSLETILKFFDAYSGSGMEKIEIRDKHPGSATLNKN
jgi:hypothetical protein